MIYIIIFPSSKQHLITKSSKFSISTSSHMLPSKIITQIRSTNHTKWR